jgi:hypothetical protein
MNRPSLNVIAIVNNSCDFRHSSLLRGLGG